MDSLCPCSLKLLTTAIENKHGLEVLKLVSEMAHNSHVLAFLLAIQCGKIDGVIILMAIISCTAGY